MVRKKSFFIMMAALMVVLIASMVIAIVVGSVGITLSLIMHVFLQKLGIATDEVPTRAEQIIIWEIRVPRAVLAATVGASLAVSGAAIQALVKNSIADPYILGVSSGASVGATAVILVGAFSFLGIYALPLAAFFGALIAVTLVFMLARVDGRTSVMRLLLAGIAVSMVFSAMTNFMLMMSKSQGGIQAVMQWMLGSLAGAKWSNSVIPFIIFSIVFSLLWLSYRQLNALLLGEETAMTMGFSIEKFRLYIIVLVSLLTGVAVSVSGSIGFVGLIIPHVVRMIIGSNYKWMLPLSALFGAIFLVWADIVARLAIAPEEMPIGIITALCGGPFFIWLLRRQRYHFGEGA